jgi:hypothetical protein
VAKGLRVATTARNAARLRPRRAAPGVIPLVAPNPVSTILGQVQFEGAPESGRAKRSQYDWLEEECLMAKKPPRISLIFTPQYKKDAVAWLQVGEVSISRLSGRGWSNRVDSQDA